MSALNGFWGIFIHKLSHRKRRKALKACAIAYKRLKRVKDKSKKLNVLGLSETKPNIVVTVAWRVPVTDS
jgi:hypothetical protein